MTIHVQCTGCGAKCQAPEKLAGKQVKCPKCAAAIVVPWQPEGAFGVDAAAEEEAAPIVLTCDCGKKLRVKSELAGKRVKCPACGEPLTVPGSQPAAQPAGSLDLDLLEGAVADAEATSGTPLQPLRKKAQPSNTPLIVGLSVGAGAVVLAVLLVFLMWPSGRDAETADNGAEPGEQSEEVVEIPADAQEDNSWLEGSAPFDMAEFLAPIPEAENAAPLYLDAFVEFDIDTLSLLVSDKEKLDSTLKQRRTAQTRRNDQYTRFDEAWRKDPKSVNLAEVETWLAEYETGFKKLADAQQRPRCAFPCPISPFSLSYHLSAARWVPRVAIWRNRRDLQRGDLERPIQSIESVLRLSRDIRHRGEMLSQLVSVAIDQMCCETMVREMLRAPGVRREHCDRLLAALARHEAEAIDPFLENQRVEYVRTRKLLHDFQHRTDVFDAQKYKELGFSKTFIFPISSLAVIWQVKGHGQLAEEKYGNLSDSGNAGEGSGKAAENWRRLLAMTDEDHAKEVEAVNRAWATILGLEGRSLLERQRVFDSGSPLVPLRETYVAILFEPDLKYHQSLFHDEAWLRGTRCLVALRRWQLENRESPQDLQAVVKAAGMPGVPIDPYCDRPFRMTVLQGEPVVYSVGKDGKDDRALADWRYGSRPGDFVFRLQANP